METQDRQQTSPVEEKLCARASGTEFIQLMRLLRRWGRLHGFSGARELVECRPDLSLRAPCEEVASLEKIAGTVRFRLTATFLALYGTTTPLPLFYTQELMREQNHGVSVGRDFIDLINNELYHLYFSIWRKHHLLDILFEQEDGAVWERLLCLIGLGNAVVRSRVPGHRAAVGFSDLASRPVRTAEGLRTVLRHCAHGDPLDVEQCVSRRVVIPEDQRLLLGVSGNTLGETAFLGTRILDRTGAFRVHVGPIDFGDLSPYFPHGEASKKLTETVRWYIDKPLVWDVRVMVDTMAMTTTRLGHPQSARLGWNSWVFSGKMRSSCAAVTYQPHSKAFREPEVAS